MMLMPRLLKRPKPEPVEEKPVAKEKDKDAIYTVGVTDDGRTVLKLHSDSGMTMTLTMNAAGVEQMIKLLAVTIESNEVEDRTDEVKG